LKYIEPTRAFGQIDFLTETAMSQRLTEFVRISDKDKLEDVMELMKDHWHMMEPHKPSLCISVIGGAKNFALEGRRKDVFNTAAQTTNAWIVTSGLNLGIVRVVGDALQEGQTWHFDRRRLSNQLRCLGISPWGYVLNRDELICSSYSTPVLYRVSNVIETGRPVSLNENHTHYIFVDEGKRLRYGGSESAKFRARLGKQMALPQQAGGWGIPVVLVVVEGGHDVFIDARDCIRERIPVVVCCGTGRASDLMNLAFYFRMKQPSKDFTAFRPEEESILLQKLIPISGKAKADSALEMIIEILRDPKLITTFDMNKSDDLDLAILFALIKTNSRINTQLELAFTWNRSDIAEEKIFRQGVRVEPESLEPTMMEALLQDKPEFVRILLQNGIIMRQFLTVERLHELYNKSTHRDAFERCLAQKGLRKPLLPKVSDRKIAPHSQSEGKFDFVLSQVAATANVFPIKLPQAAPVYLSTVSRLSRKMIGRFTNKIYDQDTEELRRRPNDWDSFRNFTFSSPFQELFLWAVLHQRQQMALFFWERAEDSLTLALIACALYADMIKSLPQYDTETQAEYTRYMDEFEMLAVRLLEECYSMDPETTLFLVENEAPLWGGYNCLNLADKATRRKFISSVACQNSLFYAWSHGTQASPFVFTVTLFCPLLLLSDRFVEFDDKRNIGSGVRRVMDERRPSVLWRPTSPSRTSGQLSTYHRTSADAEIDFGLKRHLTDGAEDYSATNVTRQPRMTLKNKLEILYTAPRTKFFLNTIAYIAFLLFFSYTLLFKIISTQITVEEAVTMTYFITLFVDIIRQICVTPGTGSYKLRLWVKTNSLVYLDIIAMLLALVSMFLRIGLASTFTVAKTFYALTLIVCYMRVFRLYGFHPALGPKLVMIQRMIAELILFLFIVAVILLSYGVSVQALLYPNRSEFDSSAIRDVFYYPYWNLYGELGLDYSFGESSFSVQVRENACLSANRCPLFHIMQISGRIRNLKSIT
uniref:LSDAT_euk domain-containing protein n=1 Tax=Echinostoma caproni TaxID=27848 RepID=A0A183AFB2_9TREM